MIWGINIGNNIFVYFGPQMVPRGPRWSPALVCSVGMQRWYAALVCSVGMQRWYAALVCSIGMQRWYAALVCSVGVQRWYAALVCPLPKPGWATAATATAATEEFLQSIQAPSSTHPGISYPVRANPSLQYITAPIRG